MPTRDIAQEPPGCTTTCSVGYENSSALSKTRQTILFIKWNPGTQVQFAALIEGVLDHEVLPHFASWSHSFFTQFSYLGKVMMIVGIATDHGAFNLKEDLARSLRNAGYQVVDFGAFGLDPSDDYSDFIIPLAQAVAAGEGSTGHCVVRQRYWRFESPPTRFTGVGAGLIHDVLSAIRELKMTT